MTHSLSRKPPPSYSSFRNATHQSIHLCPQSLHKSILLLIISTWRGSSQCPIIGRARRCSVNFATICQQRLVQLLCKAQLRLHFRSRLACCCQLAFQSLPSSLGFRNLALNPH